MTPKRSSTSFAGDSLGFSAEYLITTNSLSCCLTSSAANTVESIARQFLHQLAAKSMSNGLFSCVDRSSAARRAELAAAASEVVREGLDLTALSSRSDSKILNAT